MSRLRNKGNLRVSWCQGRCTHLPLVGLELSVAVEEAGLVDLRYPLALFEVDQTPPVELTLSLPGLFVHLGHDALNQLQLRSTKHCTE